MNLTTKDVQDSVSVMGETWIRTTHKVLDEYRTEYLRLSTLPYKLIVDAYNPFAAERASKMHKIEYYFGHEKAKQGLNRWLANVCVWHLRLFSPARNEWVDYIPQKFDWPRFKDFSLACREVMVGRVDPDIAKNFTTSIRSKADLEQSAVIQRFRVSNDRRRIKKAAALLELNPKGEIELQTNDGKVTIRADRTIDRFTVSRDGKLIEVL